MLKNYVNDYAGLIQKSEKDSLNTKISRYEKSSGMEIAIVTVNTLGDGVIEYLTRDIFDVWGVGKKGANNGIVIAVSEKEHKWRVQTGYGAEIVLTDAMCYRLASNNLTPNFKKR